MSLRNRCVTIALAASVSLLGASSDGTPRGVVPGTPAQVARLVAASRHIAKLSPAAARQLQNGGTDTAYHPYPSSWACAGSLKGCVFGDAASRTVVVLFGDSHMLMWLPAIAPAAKRAGVKLVLIYANSCPVAIIGNFSLYQGTDGSLVGCERFRNVAIEEIHAMNPSAVIIAERTTLVYSEPKHVLFTPLQWQLSLETTILRLRTPTMKVAVMQDTNWFEVNPVSCLAAYPSEVWRCDEPNPNRRDYSTWRAEYFAAKATGATFIWTRSWLCTEVCSPVVGRYITNFDNGHLSATYAAYLSRVVGDVLRPVF